MRRDGVWDRGPGAVVKFEGISEWKRKRRKWWIKKGPMGPMGPRNTLSREKISFLVLFRAQFLGRQCKTRPHRPHRPLAFDVPSELKDRMRIEFSMRKDWLDIWPGWHTLVEPSLGSTAGCPDAHLVDGPQFLPGWVEFKALDQDGLFKMERSQLFWARQYCVFNCRVAVVVMGDEGWYAVPIKAISELPFLRAYDPGAFPHRYTLWSDTSPSSIVEAIEAAYGL